MKRFFSNSVNSLFGDKTDGSDKGLLGRFSEDFMDGYKQFKRTLFGEKDMTDKEKNETLSQLTATVKKRLPKAIGSGLLGASLMINTCKTALTKLESAVAKKIPGVKGLTSSVDDIFKKLLASSDTIWKKFGSKIQLYVIDGAADFIPIVGQVTEAAMTVWDIGTGLTAGNAGNLFQVQTNEIDLNIEAKKENLLD